MNPLSNEHGTGMLIISALLLTCIMSIIAISYNMTTQAEHSLARNYGQYHQDFYWAEGCANMSPALLIAERKKLVKKMQEAILEGVIIDSTDYQVEFTFQFSMGSCIAIIYEDPDEPLLFVSVGKSGPQEISIEFAIILPDLPIPPDTTVGEEEFHRLWWKEV